ncbi:uncharacterized protein BDV14DRAFT_203042 [Aspergillus stella-maris]|uniref:uncharacterized protein n=1 Tax=Aspergillus stella-maris TaxID=1810926 RepID=UPI003CCD30AF
MSDDCTKKPCSKLALGTMVEIAVHLAQNGITVTPKPLTEDANAKNALENIAWKDAANPGNVNVKRDTRDDLSTDIISKMDRLRSVMSGVGDGGLDAVEGGLFYEGCLIGTIDAWSFEGGNMHNMGKQHLADTAMDASLCQCEVGSSEDLWEMQLNNHST